MNAIFQEMLRAGVYKRSQGRITRQVTFAALALGRAIGMWRLSEELKIVDTGFYFGLSKAVFLAALSYGLPFLLLLLGWWICLPGRQPARVRRFPHRRRSRDEQGLLAFAGRIVPGLGGRAVHDHRPGIAALCLRLFVAGVLLLPENLLIVVD